MWGARGSSRLTLSLMLAALNILCYQVTRAHKLTHTHIHSHIHIHTHTHTNLQLHTLLLHPEMLKVTNLFFRYYKKSTQFYLFEIIFLHILALNEMLASLKMHFQGPTQHRERSTKQSFFYQFSRISEMRETFLIIRKTCNLTGIYFVSTLLV